MEKNGLLPRCVQTQSATRQRWCQTEQITRVPLELVQSCVSFSVGILCKWSPIKSSNLTNHSATADDVWGILEKHAIISSTRESEPYAELHLCNQSSFIEVTKSARTYKTRRLGN